MSHVFPCPQWLWEGAEQWSFVALYISGGARSVDGWLKCAGVLTSCLSQEGSATCSALLRCLWPRPWQHVGCSLVGSRDNAPGVSHENVQIVNKTLPGRIAGGHVHRAAQGGFSPSLVSVPEVQVRLLPSLLLLWKVLVVNSSRKPCPGPCSSPQGLWVWAGDCWVLSISSLVAGE